MTTIEKLARAIYEKHMGECVVGWPWDPSALGGQEYWIGLARAVLTALMEPSGGVIDAGIDALNDCVDSDSDSGPDGESSNSYTTIRSDAAATTFRAMIQAALDEKEG